MRMRIMTGAYGRKNNGHLGFFYIHDGKISDITFGNFPYFGSSVETYPIKFRGESLHVTGSINGDTFIPDMNIGIKQIIRWCYFHRNVSKDLFEKFGVPFILPHFTIIWSHNYEKYVSLVNLFLEMSEF